MALRAMCKYYTLLTLRNTIPKKAQHCPRLLKPRKHFYGEQMDPHKQNNLWWQGIKEGHDLNVMQILSGPWQTMAHWHQEGEPHKSSPPSLPCRGREEHPCLMMSVAKIKEKILHTVEPCGHDGYALTQETLDDMAMWLSQDRPHLAHEN